MGGCHLELRFSKVQGATILLRGSSASAQSSFPKNRAVWGAASRAIPAIGQRPPSLTARDSSGRSVYERVQPNKRMKLSCRSGHGWRNKSFLIVAAPARSLCAIR
jgi:hypothetical protein